MFAIVNISGKQFKVEPGLKLKVPHQNYEIGKKVSYDRVLLLDNDKNIEVGTPTVANTIVEVTILEHNRDKKVIVFKKKRRKGYKKKNTHRQEYSLIQVESIKKKSAKKTISTDNKTTEDSKTAKEGE